MKKIYTYSDARQHLSAVLEEAEKYGQVRIKRRDGSVFVVSKEAEKKSPLEGVPTVRVDISLEDILESIRDGRDRIADGIIERRKEHEENKPDRT